MRIRINSSHEYAPTDLFYPILLKRGQSTGFVRFRGGYLGTAVPGEWQCRLWGQSGHRPAVQWDARTAVLNARLPRARGIGFWPSVPVFFVSGR